MTFSFYVLKLKTRNHLEKVYLNIFCLQVSPHSLKIFKAYANSRNIEKYLVSCFRTVQVNPSIKMYDIVMRDFMQRVMGKPVVHIEEKWAQQCWYCEVRKKYFAFAYKIKMKTG